MEKPFKTHEELINLLISRGIDISTADSKSFAKKKLQRTGYYNLINGYSHLFVEKGKTDVYIKGTTIEEIYSLYIFDKKLREIFLHYILQIETNIKSLIAYYFPMNHPEANYLVFTNFDSSKKNSNKYITELISEIQRQIAGRSSDPSISHYLTKYGYVPLWVLNNILTFGTISKMYSLMLQKERQEISKTFRMTDNELESALFYISSIRNFCAHGNRLYCFRSKRPLTDMDIHNSLNIPKSDTTEYLYGKRDLFAAMIVFKRLLSRGEFNHLVSEVNKIIKQLESNLNVLPISIVLEYMGFPNNWKSILLKK